MANDDEIIVRTRDFEMGPDVEAYLEKLKKDGTLDKLSKEGNLNVESIKKTSLGKACEIFPEHVGKTICSGDIVIFGNSATFEIFSGEAG